MVETEQIGCQPSRRLWLVRVATETRLVGVLATKSLGERAESPTHAHGSQKGEHLRGDTVLSLGLPACIEGCVCSASGFTARALESDPNILDSRTTLATMACLAPAARRSGQLSAIACGAPSGTGAPVACLFAPLSPSSMMLSKASKQGRLQPFPNQVHCAPAPLALTVQTMWARCRARCCAWGWRVPLDVRLDLVNFRA